MFPSWEHREDVAEITEKVIKHTQANRAVFAPLTFAAPAGGGGVQPDHPGGGRAGPAVSEHLPPGSAAGPAAAGGRGPAPSGALPVPPGLSGGHADRLDASLF